MTELEVIELEVIELEVIGQRGRRLAERLASGETARYVYCGRLTPPTGILDSVDIIAKCHVLRTPVEFDIIGHGEQFDEIQSLIEAWGLQSSIRLLGRMACGPEPFVKLRQYDGLLFTPLIQQRFITRRKVGTNVAPNGPLKLTTKTNRPNHFILKARRRTDPRTK